MGTSCRRDQTNQNNKTGRLILYKHYCVHKPADVVIFLLEKQADQNCWPHVLPVLEEEVVALQYGIEARPAVEHAVQLCAVIVTGWCSP